MPIPRQNDSAPTSGEGRVYALEQEIQRLREEVDSLRGGTSIGGGGHAMMGWAVMGMAALGVLLGLFALLRH